MPDFTLADILLANQAGGAFGTQTPQEEAVTVTPGSMLMGMLRSTPPTPWWIHAIRGAISGTNPVQTDEPGWWGGQSIQGNQINQWEKLPPEKVVPDLGPANGRVLTPEDASRKTLHPSYGTPETYGAGRYKLYANPYTPLDDLNRAQELLGMQAEPQR